MLPPVPLAPAQGVFDRVDMRPVDSGFSPPAVFARALPRSSHFRTQALYDLFRGALFDFPLWARTYGRARNPTDTFSGELALAPDFMK